LKPCCARFGARTHEFGHVSAARPDPQRAERAPAL
jgi:hypothetical protein